MQSSLILDVLVRSKRWRAARLALTRFFFERSPEWVDRMIISDELLAKKAPNAVSKVTIET